MQKTQRLLLILASVPAISIIGATLMMGFDMGGTRWLQFTLYSLFFASISSSNLFSSQKSCSSMLHALRSRS